MNVNPPLKKYYYSFVFKPHVDTVYEQKCYNYSDK